MTREGCFRFALASAVALCLVGNLSELVPVFRDATPFTRLPPAPEDAYAAYSARRPSGTRVTVWRTDDSASPSGLSRSIVLRLGWMCGFTNVVETRTRPAEGAFVIPVPFDVDGTFSTDDPSARSETAVPVPVWREAVGLLVPLSVSFLLLFLLHFADRSSDCVFPFVRLPSCLSALLLFISLSYLALSHPFVGPSGTGVCGGRAAYAYAIGVWPFAVEPGSALAYAETAYPPLQAVLTWISFVLAGGCGDWLTQLGAVIWWTTAYAAACTCTDGSRRVCIVLAPVFLSAPMCFSVAAYGMEPLMLAFVLTGFACVLKGKTWGWILIGSSALVKNEGLFLAVALYAGWRVSGGRRGFFPLLIGLVPAFAWHVVCRFLGATLNDCGPIWAVDVVRGGQAVLAAAEELFLRPWRYGCLAYLLPFAVWAGRRVRAAAAVFLLAFGACVWAFAVGRAPDPAWHFAAWPRLLFPIALLAGLVCYNDRDGRLA